MNKSNYTFLEQLGPREVAQGHKVTNKQGTKLFTTWLFDVSQAPNVEAEWKSVFQDVVKKLLHVDSPCVGDLFEGGVGEAPYLMFPYDTKGESLEDYIAREGQLSEDESLCLLKDLLSGLQALHKKGLFMGQLSPQFVYRVPHPRLGFCYMIADPCVSRLSFSIFPDAYATFVEANPHRCAPESLFDLVSNECSDLYCAAQLVFEVLLNNHPLKGQGREAAQALYESQTSSLEEGVELKGMSEDLTAWFKRALTFLPSERISEIAEAIKSLPSRKVDRKEMFKATKPAALEEESISPVADTPVTSTISHTQPITTAQQSNLHTQGHTVNSSITGVLTSATTTNHTATLAASNTSTIATVTAAIPTASMTGSVAPMVKSAEKRKGFGLWIFLGMGGLIVIAAIIVMVSSMSTEVVIPGQENKESEVGEDKGYANWHAKIQRLSPQIVSTSPVKKGKPQKIDIQKAEKISFEFICNISKSKSGSPCLMGGRNKSSHSGIYYCVQGEEPYCGFADYKVRKTVKFKGETVPFKVDMHLIYVFEKGKADLYMNGKKLKGVITKTLPPHGKNVGVGSQFDLAQNKFITYHSVDGDIYRYAVYNKALTAEEVSVNYAAYIGE